MKQVEIPWARLGSWFTLLFDLLVLSLSREISVAAMAEMTSAHANWLWHMLEHYVERVWQTVDMSRFRKLGIHEFLAAKVRSEA